MKDISTVEVFIELHLRALYTHTRFPCVLPYLNLQVLLGSEGKRFDQRIITTLHDVTRLLEDEHGVSKLTMIQHRQEIKDCFRQQVTQTAEARYVHENHSAYLEDLYAKEAMRLHCAFGHCSDKMLLCSLEKHNVPHRHLRKYVRWLECQACLLMLGQRQYRTKKSTVSHSETLPVASDDLPGNRSNLDEILSADSVDLDDLDDLPSNRSNLDLSTLVPTDKNLRGSFQLFALRHSYHCFLFPYSC